MKIAVLEANEASRRGHWMEAHKAGCQHLRQRGAYGVPIGTDAWTFDVETLEDAAEEIASDFIDEGSMTLEDALRDIHFAPCLDGLPRRPEPELELHSALELARSLELAASLLRGADQADLGRDVDGIAARLRARIDRALELSEESIRPQPQKLGDAWSQAPGEAGDVSTWEADADAQAARYDDDPNPYSGTYSEE